MSKKTKFDGLLQGAVKQQVQQNDTIKNMIVIDEELKNWIPALAHAEWEQLKENILSKGCLDALVLWQRGEEYVLVDGHNRYQICKDFGLDFEVKVVDFEDKEAVKMYMLNIQLGRRNLTPEQLSYLRGKRYAQEKAKISNKEGKNQYVVSGQNDHQASEVVNGQNDSQLLEVVSGQNDHQASGVVNGQNNSQPLEVVSGQNDHQASGVVNGQNNSQLLEVVSGQNDHQASEKTSEQLGKEFQVGEKTIRRDYEFAQAIDKIGEINPSIKKEILMGKTNFTKMQVQEIAKMDLPVIETVADLESLFSLPKTENPIDELQAKKNFLVKFIKKTNDLMSLEQIEKLCLDLAKKP